MNTSSKIVTAPEYKQKAIRSYVIRGGRITDGQKRAFDQWWPRYGLSLFDGILNPEDVFSNRHPLIVEIGFGMGDSLLAMAKAEPDKNFIGAEVHPPGVGRLINCAGKSDVKNLRVYMADALDVLEDCIPDGTIDRLQLFFPDPWHKKKHNKRRIVQLQFLELVRRKLKAGGILHMATDWREYAEYMMEVMCQAEGFTNTAGDYLFAERPPYRPTTKFEVRGERLGHAVWDIVFSRR